MMYPIKDCRFMPFYVILGGLKKFDQDYSFSRQTYLASDKNALEARFAFLTPAGQRELKNFVEYIIQKSPHNFLEKNDRQLKAVLKKIERAVKTKKESVDATAQIKKLANFLSELLRFSIISEATVWYLQVYIRKYLEKKLRHQYHYQTYIDLIAPVSRQYLSEERLALLKIAQKSKGKIISSRLSALLKKHADKFFWIKNSYADDYYLDEEYFKREINKIINSPEDFTKELSKLASYIQNVRAKKKRILNRFGPKDKRLFFAVRWIEHLATWQDMRKQGAARLSYLFERTFKQLSQEINWPVGELKCLFPEEILKIKTKEDKQLRRIVEKRKIAVVFLLDKGRLTVREGKGALFFEKRIAPLKAQALKELKGLPAFGGKIIGRAQVLKSVTEIRKFKKGNILVSSNTTPDWLPAMRVAKAILTEKGGITSHAAIVSRELKKPCIVGIKNITLIIKNKDRLEVDANQGIAKIIERD